MLEGLQDLLIDVMETFANVRNENFNGNPWRQWLKDSALNVLGEFARSQGLYVKVGTGDGGWPEIPWIGLRSELLASTSQRGIYVAILFNKRLDGFTLSIQQGIAEMRDAIGIKRSRPVLLSRAEMIRKRNSPPERFGVDTIDLGASERRGRLYQVAHVCGRGYSRAALSADIAADLRELVAYYLSLAEDSQIIGTVNAIPTLEEFFPDIARDSEELDDERYARKYSVLIAEIAKDATLNEDDVLGGTKMTNVLTNRRIGQEGLRKALLDLYEPRCAACGNAASVSHGNPRKPRLSLHAAHIVGVEHGGRTRVYNGILLCPNHHWGFDNYCWWIEPDGRLTVRDDLKSNPLLAELHGRTLLAPSADWAKPREKALARHRKRAQAASSRPAK